MLYKKNPINYLKASGTPFEIGRAMGVEGSSAVHQHLIHSDIWAMATSPEHTTMVTRLIKNTTKFFPEIHEEITGLAKGLELPLVDVYAWNCRGDILASVPDGCTTIQTPGPEITISHNEDGMPFFRGQCFIVDTKPERSKGFRAFCYPGSLAGHTFGWNDYGLVQTVNNLRLQKVQATIPRMVLSRAVLSSSTLKEAINILSDEAHCGGFHITLAQVGDNRLIGVEYGAGKVSVKEITVRSVHTNHALHLQHHSQIITKSSLDRQNNGERLLSEPSQLDLDILRDSSSVGLPIWRDDPDDPDHENTLATCTFSISSSSIIWQIYNEKEGRTAYHSNLKVSNIHSNYDRF